MTTQQFSDEFDILINSQALLKQYGFTQGLELDEYEKSVYLSNAQEELVRNIYEGVTLKGDSFEESEIKRRYLDKLIKQQTVTSTVGIPSTEKIDDNSVFFQLPTDVMVITFEQLEVASNQDCYDGKKIDILPLRQDEYLMHRSNPFKKPTMKGRTNHAWRLDYGNNVLRVVEIVHPDEVTASKYIVRYIRKPKPIILETLDNLDIDGETDQQTSELDNILHRQILQLAVLKALQSKSLMASK
jgi:hypothetical protein